SDVKFVGFKNYIDIWSDDWFLKSLFNNSVYTFFTVPVTMALALGIAIILNKYVFAKGVFRTIFFLPHMTNIATLSIIWIAMYNKFGPIRNFFVEILGIENAPVFLSDPKWALWCLIVMGIWNELGYITIFYISGLQSIPTELYEAAEIDGADAWQRLRLITVPLLSQTTFFVLVTSLITSFKVFGQVNMMTDGGPLKSTSVLVYYIYKAAFTLDKMGYASAMAGVLFVIIFAIILMQWRQQKKWTNY
ncbi:MAG: sugar ABC transporter permease, partial [Ruthenibacterium sp.]